MDSSTQALVDLGQVCREASQANPGGHHPETRCRAVQAKRVILYCQEKPLASDQGARTPNQRRWARREYEGDRENPGQGTRQIASVTSGEGRPR